MLQLKNNKTVKRIIHNTIYLSIGSLLTKLIGLIVFLYIARELGPSSYGKYWLIIEFVGIFAIISNFGLDMTALREGAKTVDNISEFQNKIFPLKLYLTLVAITSAIAISLILPYSFEIKLLIWSVSLTLLFGHPSGISDHFSSSFRILEKMHFISIIQIFRMIIFAVLIVFFSYFMNLKVFYVIIVFILCNCISFILKFLLSKKFVNYRFTLKLDKKFTKYIFKTSLWFGSSYLLYTIMLKANIQLIYLFSDSTQVGFYSAAWQIVIGFQLFLSAFSLSAYPVSSRNIFNPKYTKTLFKVIFILSLLSIIICILIVLFSDPIINLFYGKDYHSSSIILSILIWFIPLRIFSMWGHHTLECTDHLKLKFKCYFVTLIISLILNIYLICNYDAKGAAIALIITVLIMTILINLSAWRVFKKIKTKGEVSSPII